ncbi:hypothetical protein BC829DRAFT_180748 [Chytridium lagenaria]|nr:hypothetical protein BC829DRAFT_180748 [Chytridium lagenaria]
MDLATIRYWSNDTTLRVDTWNQPITDWNRPIASVSYWGGTRHVTVAALREAVLKAEAENGTTDVQRISTFTTRNGFEIGVEGLVDRGCRRVYALAIRVSSKPAGNTNTSILKDGEEEWIGFLMLPEYGDAVNAPVPVRGDLPVTVEIGTPLPITSSIVDGFSEIPALVSKEQPAGPIERRRPISSPPSIIPSRTAKEPSTGEVAQMLGLLPGVSIKDLKDSNVALGLGDDSPFVKAVSTAMQMALEKQSKMFLEKMEEVVAGVVRRPVETATAQRSVVVGDEEVSATEMVATRIAAMEARLF